MHVYAVLKEYSFIKILSLKKCLNDYTFLAIVFETIKTAPLSLLPGL